jgi:hypothetical protein
MPAIPLTLARSSWRSARACACTPSPFCGGSVRRMLKRKATGSSSGGSRRLPLSAGMRTHLTHSLFVTLEQCVWRAVVRHAHAQARRVLRVRCPLSLHARSDSYVCHVLLLFFRNILLSYNVLLALEAPTLSQKQQMQTLNAESRFYTTAEYVFYPFEMAAVVLALILVLHRVKDFVFGTHDGRSIQQQRAKRIILRSFVGVVVACILLSICSCFAASALFYAGATFNSDAAGV